MVAVPKDSSTLVLLRRDNGPGARFEVLMLRRHARSSFLPGTYVFPGGALEAADCADQMEGMCYGMKSLQARETIDGASPPVKALGFFVAAIREAFEEAGILLAYREPPHLVAIGEEDASRFAGYRRQVSQDPSSFATIIQEEGLLLATDKLSYFAHWITPHVSPIRFDTRFFVAPAPPDQEALHDELETTDSVWISPQEAVEKRRRGEMAIPYPTYCNVRDLAQFSSVEAVISSTRGKEIPAIQPLLDMLTFG